MRASLLATLVLLGCGGSHAKAPTPELKEPPAQEIDVKELTPPGPGFTFSTTVHRTKVGSADGGTVSVDAAVDTTYTVEVVAADHVKVTFTTAQQTSDGVATAWPLADHGYDISPTGLTHLDGTAITAEETAGLTAFYQEGGLSLPVREALVAQRLTKDEHLQLDKNGVEKLLVLGVPHDTTGAVWLLGVDADGIATIGFSGNGTIDELIQFTFKGTATLDVTTLMPRTLDYETTLGGYLVTDDKVSTGMATGTSSQTFTY